MNNKEIILTPKKANILAAFILFLFWFIVGIILAKNDNSIGANIMLIILIVPLIYTFLSLIFKINYIKITKYKLIIRNGFVVHDLNWKYIKNFYPLTVPTGINFTRQAVCIELKPEYIDKINWGDLKIFSKPYGYKNNELCSVLNSYLSTA